MYIVQLIYASRPARRLDRSELDEVLDESRANNARDALTGILCCGDDFFLQWIEGPRGPMNRLYERLVADERHHDLELLDYRYVHSRQFADWSMACIRSEQLSDDLVGRFKVTSEFDPYELSGEAARAFLIEASEEVPVR